MSAHLLQHFTGLLLYLKSSDPPLCFSSDNLSLLVLAGVGVTLLLALLVALLWFWWVSEWVSERVTGWLISLHYKPLTYMDIFFAMLLLTLARGCLASYLFTKSAASARRTFIWTRVQLERFIQMLCSFMDLLWQVSSQMLTWTFAFRRKHF